MGRADRIDQNVFGTPHCYTNCMYYYSFTKSTEERRGRCANEKIKILNDVAFLWHH